jgi:hypothetical protein
LYFELTIYYCDAFNTKAIKQLKIDSFAVELIIRSKTVISDPIYGILQFNLFTAYLQHFPAFQHDMMQVSFLIAAGMWDSGKEPPYASAIIFELHETAPDSFTVRILFKNDTVTNPEGEPMLMTVAGTL